MQGPNPVALESESKLFLRPFLRCDISQTPVSRVANHVLRASTLNVPMSLKRKSSSHEPEEHEAEGTTPTKIMTFMAPRNTRQRTSDWSFYEEFARQERMFRHTRRPGILPQLSIIPM
ncbi:hypothetical protein BKA70DRAFT_1330216 [Coprinopsis sp. MPI-PUGE-AT-0042]|nr:hypothetical protein BKA70DRAFT_1330216 [Coprinopsis sp. MPI-PUGE-AT-0042]